MSEKNKALKSASVTLPAFGTLQDQRTGEVTAYDPDAIAPDLQWGILDFISDPPRDTDDNKKWLAVLASRQVGKSVCTSLATYIRTAYTPGAYAAIIADTKERSEDLFRAIITCHNNMPKAVRADTIPNAERRQITFKHNGKIRTLTGGANMVGIGRAYDSIQLSELPFWANAAEAWNGIFPAIVNRAESSVVLESTPAPMHQPSAEWYRDICSEARKGMGRWRFLFAAYFNSRLNERTWDRNWTLTKSEVYFLEQHGPKNGEPISAPGNTTYLTLENLAFRRHVMDMDPEVRRSPELFDVYYPRDPINCWVSAGGGAIPAHVLEAHLKRVVVPWVPKDNMSMVYEEPQAGAVYVLGADPAGWLGGDQAAFQVLKVYADEVVQVMCFSSNEVTPPDFAVHIMEAAAKYNHALVIVENNGVGQGALGFLDIAANRGITLRSPLGADKEYHLKRLYYHKLAGRAGQSKPGWPAGAKTNAESLACLIDLLMTTLRIHDAETLEQVQTYRRDKEVAPADKWNILNPGKTLNKRRGKHHWDRVSALALACVGARHLPQRMRPRTDVPDAKDPPRKGLTLEDTKFIERQVKAAKRREKKRRRRTRRLR